jgi:hypothetical protein
LQGKLPPADGVEQEHSPSARRPYDNAFARIAGIVHAQGWKTGTFEHVILHR